MDHNGRLQLIGRVTYYLGWIALLCAGLVHLNIENDVYGDATIAAELV